MFTKKFYFHVPMLVVTLLTIIALACGGNSSVPSSTSPQIGVGNSESDELRKMAYELYQAIGRQDLQAIVALMDPTDTAFHKNCDYLPQAFSGVTFELSGADQEKIHVTIFPQTEADKANGIRRAWTEKFSAAIRVNGGQWKDTTLGSDKFIDRGNGWKVAGFYVVEADIGMPRSYSCGRWKLDDWH